MVLFFNEKVINLRTWQFYLENSLFTFIISLICLFIIKLFKRDLNLDTYEHFQISLIDKLRGETKNIIKSIYEIEKTYISSNFTKKYLDNIRNLGKYNIKLISDSCNKCVNINDYINIINQYNDNHLKISKNVSNDQIIQCKTQCQEIIKRIKEYSEKYKNILRNNISEKSFSKRVYLLDNNTNRYIYKIIEVTNQQMDNISEISNQNRELCNDIHGKIKYYSNQLNNINNNNLDNYINNVKDKIRDNIDRIIDQGKKLLREDLKFAKRYLQIISTLGNNQLNILSDLELIRCNAEYNIGSEGIFNAYLLEKSQILEEDMIYNENTLDEQGIDCELSLDALRLDEECLSKSFNDVDSHKHISHNPRLNIDRYGILNESEDKYCPPCKILNEYEIVSESKNPITTERNCPTLYPKKIETESPQSIVNIIDCPVGFTKEQINIQEELNLGGLPSTLIVEGLNNSHVKFNKCGLYHIIPEKIINGHGVWKQENNEVYIFYNKYGHWIFGKFEDMYKGEGNGWIFAKSNAISPSLVKGNWYIYSNSLDLRCSDNNITCEENMEKCGWIEEPNLHIRNINLNS